MVAKVSESFQSTPDANSWNLDGKVRRAMKCKSKVWNWFMWTKSFSDPIVAWTFSSNTSKLYLYRISASVHLVLVVLFHEKVAKMTFFVFHAPGTSYKVQVYRFSFSTCAHHVLGRHCKSFQQLVWCLTCRCSLWWTILFNLTHVRCGNTSISRRTEDSINPCILRHS